MTDDANFPVWKNDAELDPAWVHKAMKLPSTAQVLKCPVEDISNESRRGDVVRNGATLKLQVSRQEDNGTCSTQSLVIKQIPPSGQAQSVQLGLSREALFYQQLAPDIGMIPKIYSSFGNMATGAKWILMEDLNGYLDSGILFGPGNPNNWNRDLRKLQRQYQGGRQQEEDDLSNPPPVSVQVADQTFSAMAQIHATFWMDTKLPEQYSDWLRGGGWIFGEMEDSWQGSQSYIQGIWSNLDVAKALDWDPLVLETVTQAMKNISWKDYCDAWKHRPWTLVHGDFWPGNVLVSFSGEDLKLLDWEMVGLGSGTQDLGQYLLSNMDPVERKEWEEWLIRNYYNSLTEGLKQHGRVEFTWEECWKEYQMGGLERWMWFLVYFCGAGSSDSSGTMRKWAQFFHNQIGAFLHDHQLGPKEIGQPRP